MVDGAVAPRYKILRRVRLTARDNGIDAVLNLQTPLASDRYHQQEAEADSLRIEGNERQHNSECRVRKRKGFEREREKGGIIRREAGIKPSPTAKE